MRWQIITLKSHQRRGVALRYIITLLSDDFFHASLDDLFQDLVSRVLGADKVDQSTDGLHGQLVNLIVLRPDKRGWRGLRAIRRGCIGWYLRCLYHFRFCTD